MVCGGFSIDMQDRLVLSFRHEKAMLSEAPPQTDPSSVGGCRVGRARLSARTAIPIKAISIGISEGEPIPEGLRDFCTDRKDPTAFQDAWEAK